MATQINATNTHPMGGVLLVTKNITLITSGTTVTFTLPVNTKIRHLFVYDVTAGTIIAGSTYVQSTGVFTSGTLTLNDVVDVSFISESAV